MKALVTGGAGFIGSHLAEALCRRGANVVVLDDLSSGDRRNLAWRQPGDALEFVQGDAGDDALLRQLVPGCDWVFHEAAIASVPWSVAHPRESHRTNLEATLTLLLAAREAGVRRFVFASSSAIYGDSDAAVKHESHPPNPLTPYGLQKFASERYARMFHEFYGLPTVSLRYFNVFGPRQAFDSPYSGVIAKFCTCLLAGQAPTIFGDGLQSRDFVYAANVVAANLLAVEQPPERVAGRVFNIGGGASVSLRQLLEELNQLTGRDLAPAFAPGRPGDVRFSEADISAARAGLGYAVEVSWREGLRRTLDFYRP
jgi:UDP-glucose 4-epimerase